MTANSNYMAGSTTQSVESFTAQGMERHQIMMNTEVMKHFRIMNRASVREIMLQHEKTFKEQVHDLHKLYEVQRLLMEKAKSRGVDGYTGAPPPTPPPPSACANAFSEEANQLRQRRNFWQQITPESVGAVKGAMPMQPLPASEEKAYPEKKMRFEDTPKTSNSPVRKRKIDLEQLPEDDSDDEKEMPALNSSLSGNLREFTHGLSGPESMIKSHPSLFDGTGLKPVQPVKESQAGNLPTGEYKNQFNVSGGSSFYLFQHGKATSLPPNIVKAEQNSLTIGDRNPTSQNACTIKMDIGAIKSNTVFLPQADLIDRASQDAGKEARWSYQAAEPNTVNRSSKSPLQQPPRLSPHVALPELSTGRSQLHNGVFQGSPNLEQRHHNNQSPSLGSVSVGDWSKVLVENQPPGLPVGAQKDRSLSLSERLGDASRWLTKEPFSQGPIPSVVPILRSETKASEGGPAMPNILAPAISVSGGKGLSQERDLNLWPSQSPILQLPQYQQPSVFQPQVFPSVNQGVWLQPPQTTKSSMYPQQMVYGVHSSDPSQIGYRNEPLQRNPGEIAGPWNMIGLGHYYSSVPSAPQKPPFKNPPKLILKNDGVGTDYKLVSPDKEMNEKANQKKATISLKKDLLQDISKFPERKSTVQKEGKDEDQKLDKRVSVGFQALGSAGQGREPPLKTSDVPLESKLLAAAAPCPTQEIILPKECSFLHDATATVTVSSITQGNVGAAAGARNGVFAAGLTVFASPDKCKSQPSVSQAENVPPSRSQEITSKKNFPSPESTKAARVKETPLMTDSCIDEDLQDQKAESSLFQCKDDHIRRDPKALPAQVPKAEAMATDIFATCQPESFTEAAFIRRDPKALSAQVPKAEAMATDIFATCQPESFTEAALAKTQEECILVANACAKRLQKSHANPCKEVEQPKGSHSTSSASSDSPSKDASHNKGLTQGRSVGHSADLANPSCLPTLQALSVQSTSTNTPATPASDRACSSSVHSPKYLVPESKHDVKLGEDLQLDFDSDKLAASILLSFAPQLDLPKQEKQAISDASAISSGGHKDRPTDQASTSSRKERCADQESRKTTQIVEGATALRRQTSNLGGSQGRRMQGQGSLKRADRMDHPGPIKSTMKDRLRTDRRNSDELETDKAGEDPIKSLTFKLPRVSGSLNAEAIPISRSKQLSKLNGVTLSGDSGDHIKNFKGNDVFHAPTGRRSSRGPPTAGRVLHESGSRVQQPTRHRLEGSTNTTERDSAVLRSKADGNMKSKAWGELNKTRSHPRKQFQDTSHRKTQR